MMNRLLKSLFAACALLLASCGSDQLMTISEATKWISAFSPECIAPDSRIRIEITDSLKANLAENVSLDDVFHFSPRIKGKGGFADNGRYIDFYPEEGQMKEGHEYTCLLRMDRLTGIDTMKNFSFVFRVARREVMMENVSVGIDPDNVGQVVVSGQLVFSHDPGDLSSDPRLLKCSEKNASVSISETEDCRVLEFAVTDIRRKDEDSSVSLQYHSVVASDRLDKEVIVPGLKEFRLMSAVNNRTSEPYVSLDFTSPLDPSQNLDGLIISDRWESLRIEKDGTNVKVFYPAGGVRAFTLWISDAVRSADGRALRAEVCKEFTQEVIPPAVEVPMNGTILPDGKNIVFPFKAVNLAAVDVEIVKIYADNVLHYLQSNDIDESYSLRRAGRLIYRRTVRLDVDKSLDLHQWNNFSVDLSDMIKRERGAIYNVRLTFRKAYSLYDRDSADDFEIVDGVTSHDDANWDKTYSYISRSAPDYDWDEYNWQDVDDPSKASYYMSSERMPDHNILASRIGLIVKKSDGQRLWTAVTDIMTARPLSGVKVTAYNYQLQEIGSGYSGETGFADFEVSNKPFIVTATDGSSISYLKVSDGREKSTSHFDVSGKKSSGGIKGYTYGERGIWRPGDDIHLTLIVEDKNRTLPANHPVTMKLYTPDGSLYDEQTLTRGIGSFYSFCIKTTEDVQTGRWRAKFEVGGSVFHHDVPVETIKPNRLKINLDLPQTVLARSSVRTKVNAQWLTGVTASNFSTVLEAVLYNNDKPFKDYPAYTFSDPLISFSQNTVELVRGNLDSLGNAVFEILMPEAENAPGMLQANIVCRVAESGGSESVTSKSVRYSPFSTYVGVDLGNKEFETDRDLKFPVVAVNADGVSAGRQELEWKIYKLGWSWWWEGSPESLDRYVTGESAEVVASGNLVTSEGKSEIPFRLDYPDWGKYLLLVKDKNGGHVSGGVVMIDWPQWRGRSDRDASGGASILSFSLDKQKYEVGETATVYLPASAAGRVLLSVENGSSVLSRRWVTTSADQETAYKMTVTKSMAPNFYVHATLLQPHKQTLNDLPIRMYGIQGAEVIDNASILQPMIQVPQTVQPQQEFSVKVRERDGRPMTYTLAIVDEGLLDINGFKTPNAWRTMNQREALGVDTWDLYDDVIGAYAGKFTSVLKVGGDEALRAAAGKEKRFNPVVKFLGPFTTGGSARTHKITLPMYVGSVRVMVVAAHEGAYGSAEANVAVKSPMMLLSTLPRVLSCGDKVEMPVNLFAMDEDIKNVSLSVETEGPVTVRGAASQNVDFTSPSEKVVRFTLACDAKAAGKARITIKAVCGEHSASETVYIDVRNPHPSVVTVQHKTLGKGSGNFAWQADQHGSVSMEISGMPAVNFSGMMSFVENYSHYCTEQLSSRAMFLLYGRSSLKPEERQVAETMMRDILKELATRQMPDGGFRYWDTSSSPNSWATSMAGEVLIEARNQGFAVSGDVIRRWVEFQTAQARNYSHTTVMAADLQQAYRLYTLVLAGKDPAAAMNRLKESKSISSAAKYRLAAAYHLAGKGSVAESVMGKESVETTGDHGTFWTALRDKAMKLEAFVLMGYIERAMPLARELADEFSSQSYVTQEVAFVSAAFSRLSKALGDKVSDVTVSCGGKTIAIKDVSGIRTMDLPVSAGKVSVENRGDEPVYVSLTNVRQPCADEIIDAQESGVTIGISYTDMNDNPLDADAIRQGTDFCAYVQVGKTDNMDSESMALTFRLPSGWEVWNERIHGAEIGSCVQDIRDDRVCMYFKLNGLETRTFRIRLTAAYAGEYLYPSAVAEDMYRADCRASSASSVVKVVR